jgi:cell division septal protein FtsQ
MRRRNPINVEPHQRYWRRRANRRVRKARRTVSLLRWSVILLVNGIVAGALLFTAEKTVDYLTSTDEFAMERIELHGFDRTSGAATLARLEAFRGRNILELDLTGVERVVEQDPWVRQAAVRRVLPGTLRVRVYERVPLALAVIDDRIHLVDSTGFVIGPTGPGLDYTLPVLTGLDSEEADVLRDRLRTGVALLSRLHRTSEEFTRAISELDLSRSDRLALRMTGGGPTILLDPQRVEQNLLHFLELREAIYRRVGTAEYVDLRWRDRISVMPASQTSKGRDF